MIELNNDLASQMEMLAKGDAARAAGNPYKIFDWNKAAELIREHKPQEASAGLIEDWGYTGGVIFEDGEAVTDRYTYLQSIWATPYLVMDGVKYECYVGEDDPHGWDSDTKWPDTALAILNK